MKFTKDVGMHFQVGQAGAIRIKSQWHAVTISSIAKCSKTSGIVLELRNDSRTGRPAESTTAMFRQNKNGTWDHVTRNDSYSGYMRSGSANDCTLANSQVGLLCTYGGMRL